MDLLIRGSEGWFPAEAMDYATETEFQAVLRETFERTLTVQSEQAVVVAREVSTPHGGRIDVVAIDQDGVISLCECKLDRNAGSRRELLGQVLEYAGALEGMTFGDFRRVMSDRLQVDLIDEMRERAPEGFDTAAWEESVGESLAAGNFRLVLAVDQLTEVLKQTVLYLNERASFSLLVAEMRRVRHNGVEMLAPSVFGDEAAQRKLPQRSTSSTVRDADTVVVAANLARPEFQSLGAYICQPKRSFRDGIEYLGFYTERTIFPEFPRIVDRRLDVPVTEENLADLRRGTDLDKLIAEALEGGLERPGRELGERQQVFLLDLDAGFALKEPIHHDGPHAWTQGQRYTTSAALKSGPTTTDALAAAEG
ncbi:MAG TPA: hypothetical protein VFJ65_12530 [Solirubrobacterales bacterium]|nr:hypothetical protein [Solirubrobacterales bacterium]